MKYASVWSVVSLVFFLCVSLSDQRTVPRKPEDEEIALSTRAVPKDGKGEGLYGPADHVLILDQNNFSATVVNNPNQAIVVEFYAHWCGHCIKFAPIWKSFAKSVYNWRDVVAIAVIDCADKTNEKVCRDYEVKGYPTIRYFPPNSPSEFKGDAIEKGEGDTPESLRLAVTQVVEKTAADGKGGASWPNLKVTENLSQALTDLPPEIKYVAVMFDKQNSSAGTELILDFKNVKELRALRVLDTNEEAVTKHGVKDFPSLYVQERGATDLTLLPVQSKTRKDFYNALKAFLKEKGIQVPDLDESGVDEVGEKPDPAKEASYDDTVYQLDLEMALRHTLFNELKLQKSFEGEALTALQKYLRILTRYFPLDAAGKEALQQFSDKVSNHQGTLTIDQYNEYIQPFESGADKFLKNPPGYVNCARSIGKPPCSLWLMFHTLTVQAEAKHQSVGDTDPQDVLNSVKGYVKYFFGCKGCSEHFQAMAVSIPTTVDSFEKSVLWLWKAHNEVNARLTKESAAGRTKIQFPSKENCPKCRNGGDWNEPEVLKYLMRVYTNISRERTAKTRKVEDEENKKNDEEKRKKKRKRSTKHSRRPKRRS